MTKKESQITTREVAPHQDIVLLPSDDVATTRLEIQQDRERTVARLRLLWQRRRLLSKILGVGIIVFLLAAFLIPSMYESTARLMPPDQRATAGLSMIAALFGGNAGAGLATAAGEMAGMKTSGDLLVGVLQSRTIQDDLINKFNLRKVYWDRKWEDARKDLTRHTDVSSDRKSGILTIKVTDRNAQRAAAMGKEYIDQLNSVMTRLDTSQAHRERVFLEQRLQEVRRDLETAEKNFGEFASKNVALDIPMQGRAMVEAAATLEGELIAAETEIQGLKQIYSDDNVRVRSTQARINELQNQLQKLGGKAGTTVDAEVPDMQSIYPSIRRLPLLGISYADLLRQTKVQEATFEVLTKQYELAKVEEAKELPTVKVLDVPDVPEKKSFPPRFLIVFLGTVSSLLLGIAWVLGIQHWAETDPQSPVKALTLGIIADLRRDMVQGSSNGQRPGNPLNEGSNFTKER